VKKLAPPRWSALRTDSIARLLPLGAVWNKLVKPIPINLHHYGDTSAITFDVPRSSNETSPARRRRVRALCPFRRLEPRARYRIDHLFDGDLLGIERNDRFFLTKTDVGSIHALQPFQGLLDRDGSRASRHALDRKDNR